MSDEVATGIVIFAVIVTMICLGGMGAMTVYLRRSEPKSKWLDPADR